MLRLLNVYATPNYHIHKKIGDYIKDGYYSEILPNKSEKYLSDLETTKRFSVYCGFDPTSDSLQLGNLAAVCGLLRCHLSGKDIIAVIGGCTCVLGDPSGRIKKRDYQSSDQYASNSTFIEQNLVQIFSNYQAQIAPRISSSENLGSIHIVNNRDWLSNVTMIDLLLKFLPFFKLPELLEKESVKLRLETANTMDLSEFLYPVVQAMDFLHLHEKYNCYMQVGGHDQIGNISCGLNLIYRKLDQRVFGLTIPLITTPDGQKLGKSISSSESGMDTLWLMGNKLKPYSFYQKILNLPDAIISDKLVQQLTFLSPDEIKQLLADHKINPHLRIVQKVLAQELTLLVHGADALQASELATRIFFPKSSVNRIDDDRSNNISYLQVIHDKLSGSERNYLISCLQPSSKFLPVIFSRKSTDFFKKCKNSHTELVDILLDLVMLGSNFQDKSEALEICCTRGVTLNDVNLLSKGKKPEILPENVKEAFNRFDSTTGLGVLRLGKHEHWFITTQM
ncbi:unnamed protein product [Heterobilharzia americana]|nr:unnamed protein product [Heterobilharzia americana]